MFKVEDLSREDLDDYAEALRVRIENLERHLRKVKSLAAPVPANQSIKPAYVESTARFGDI